LAALRWAQLSGHPVTIVLRDSEALISGVVDIEGNITGVSDTLRRVLCLGDLILRRQSEFHQIPHPEFIRETLGIPSKALTEVVQYLPGKSFEEIHIPLLRAYDAVKLYEEGVYVQLGELKNMRVMKLGVAWVRARDFRSSPVALATPPLKILPQTSLWLDPQRTSVLDFYQWFLNYPLSIMSLTFLKDEEVPASTASENQKWQAVFAEEVIAWVHSREAAESARVMSDVLYHHPDSPPETWGSHVGVCERVTLASETSLLDVVSGITASKAEARRSIFAGAVRVNGEKVTDPKFAISQNQPLILRLGKTRIVVGP
jgi:tyrosyl-tRNA synthetase